MRNTWVKFKILSGSEGKRAASRVDSKFVSGLDACLNREGVISQSEVVVGREIESSVFFSLRIPDLHFDIGGTNELSFFEPEPILFGFGDVLIIRIVSFEKIFSLGVAVELDKLLHGVELQALGEVRQSELLLFLGHSF